MNTRHLKMNELPMSEQPFEKCRLMGPEALSDAELLAIIINSGTRDFRAMEVALALLGRDADHPGLEGLCLADRDGLMSVTGIGNKKALQLMAVIELSRRMTRIKYSRGINICSPESVAEYYMPFMQHLRQEELHVMMLNTRNQLIRDQLVTRGTVNASLIDSREIFIYALKENAVSIILVHNHPSGDPTPSEEDISATMKVKKAGEILGIQLLDHIVIGRGTFTSILNS